MRRIMGSHRSIDLGWHLGTDWESAFYYHLQKTSKLPKTLVLLSWATNVFFNIKIRNKIHETI